MDERKLVVLPVVLSLRFREHVMDDTSHYGRSLRDNLNGFVVLQLEKSLLVLCYRSIVNGSPLGFHN